MGWQWHQLDHMHIICTSLQTDATPVPHHSVFYRLECMPFLPPNQQCQSTGVNCCCYRFTLLYRTTCIRWHPQLKTWGFCWSKVLLRACPCWRQRDVKPYSLHSLTTDGELWLGRCSSSQRCYLHRLCTILMTDSLLIIERLIIKEILHH